MATSSAELHEAGESLRPETIERHRAIVSLMEELEAVDWYDQRIDATQDPELRGILQHNRDEEKEHAAMALEWLRRHDPALDRFLRMYLFTTEPILEREAAHETAGPGEQGPDTNGHTLGLGSLVERRAR
jgi:hypothetical protein